jgi:hypothetical protein
MMYIFFIDIVLLLVLLQMFKVVKVAFSGAEPSM